ncbi:sensor histidine kinase [Mucilaginibacter segetis]|uniref:histidine kinase n=1 Tax=Mucilaginibacter segetis TaxID=2793071 RepID=A0A934ULA5_9SPHI|nr:HAMP domain-containing sensor histidine kinase [Mucilaginibacter segetis]MBK0378338.1 HAMP domain-containing histidine kinase [Mucilaginibacter segetis]
MSFLANINKLWIRLVGSTTEFPLEGRIFHSLCIVALFALAYNVPFNWIIGLPYVAFASLVTFCVFILLYYVSRHHGKMKMAIMVFAIVGNLLFAVNFFLNSGTFGPTDMLLGLSTLLLICVVPRKQKKLWVGINLLMVIGLHLTEYYHPELIPDTYLDRKGRFLDITSAYVVVVIVIYFTVTYLKRNYDYEKRSSAEKAEAIQKKNQQIIEQNQELERINTERNKLMSIIAHDLRSPLSNIQNYLELVTEYELDTAERKLVEDDLLKVTRRTIDMLGKLLMWSKGQMGGVSVKLGYVTLRDALFNTLELDRSIALKKNITLTADLDWDTKIIADNDMLQLVIRNLLNNAIKFTRPGGSIYFKAEQKDGECWLIVSDNGIGITDEKRNELFSLRAESTFGTEREKGVGLGLLLCKEFTEMQGGRIWLESTQNHGTTFYVAMPTGN